MKKGFTLIELLVVVLIIGILSAVALPQYQKAVEKSRVMTLIPNLRALSNALEMYYLANGTYPRDSLADLDISELSGCVAEANGQIKCPHACFNYNGGDDKFASDLIQAFTGDDLDCAYVTKARTLIVWDLEHSKLNAGKKSCTSKVAGLCKSLGYE